MNIGNENKVSVIIPTFNRAGFIPNAVNSIINQKHDNIEIIIVDDGSDDNTEAVVNSLMSKYSSIIYCHNERSKGPSGARNTGILKATGDYLTFLDSDDVWLNDHLAKGLKVLNEHPEIDAVFGNYSIIDFKSGKHLFNFFDNKETLHKLKSVQLESGVKLLRDNLFTALLRDNFFSLCSLIVKKSLCANIFLDESIAFSEDRDFAIKLYKQAHATFAYRQDPVFTAYKHNSNIYNTKDIDWQQVTEAHLYLFIKYLNSFNLSRKEKRALTKALANKLSTLANIHGRNREYSNAFSCMVKSFKYGLTFTQFKDVISVIARLTLFPNTDNASTSKKCS